MTNKEFKTKCLQLNKRLSCDPGLTATKRLYHRAFKPGLASRMYRGKLIHFCTECGCTINYIGQKECPQCHAKWTEKKTVELYNRTVDRSMNDIAVFEAHGDIQMVRQIRVERILQYGKPAKVCAYEVVRFMYAPNGERMVWERPVQTMTGAYDLFSKWGRMRLRREISPRNMSYGGWLRKNMWVYDYQIKSLTKQWKYKNIPKLMEDYDYSLSAIRVIAYPYGETLLKCGQKTLFDHLVRQRDRLPKGAEKAVNICIRHHYTIDDPSLWLDTLYMLVNEKKDIHNPKFVCPVNLRVLHQILLNRKHKRDDALRARWEAIHAVRMEQARLAYDRWYAEQQKKREAAAKEAEEGYPKHFGKMLSLELDANNLSIRPLQSVDEFKDEAKHMHHCVYACEYWNYKSHPTALILSAKDDAGKRLATIEYNMETNTIVQCRAACNQVPERDKEIRQLITDNKAQFVKLEQTVKTIAKAA